MIILHALPVSQRSQLKQNKMNLKIYLIDDDLDDQMFFSVVMKEIDENILCFLDSDGSSIEELVKNPINLPALFFIDIHINAKSGWFYLNLIKNDAQLSAIPVIMYSTSPSPKDVEKAKNDGALLLIAKHDEYYELLHCMRKIITHLKEGTLNIVTHSEVNCMN